MGKQRPEPHELHPAGARGWWTGDALTHDSVYGRPLQDGWIGVPEMPGYRADRVVAKLGHVPELEPRALYFDVLLLNATGQTVDNQSGVCRALHQGSTADERSAFVRVVAELLRPARSEPVGLSSSAHALALIRERGVAGLALATQMLDGAWEDATVALSLERILVLCLGPQDALETMCDVVARLALRGDARLGLDAADAASRGFEVRRARSYYGVLGALILYLVRTIGKTRARRHLQQVTGFHLVPSADLVTGRRVGS